MQNKSVMLFLQKSYTYTVFFLDRGLGLALPSDEGSFGVGS